MLDLFERGFMVNAFNVLNDEISYLCDVLVLKIPEKSDGPKSMNITNMKNSKKNFFVII